MPLVALLFLVPSLALAQLPPVVAPNDAGSGKDAGGTPEASLAVEPGAHRGALARGLDEADWYAFHASALDGVHIEHLEGDVILRVVAPDGRVHLLAGSWASISPVDGTWHVEARVRPLNADAMPSYEWRLTRVPLAAQDDAGSGRDAGDVEATAVLLRAGVHEGSLAPPYDAADAYNATPPPQESLMVRVTTTSGHLTVSSSGQKLPEGWLYFEPWQAHTVRVASTGDATYRIEVRALPWATLATPEPIQAPERVVSLVTTPTGVLGMMRGGTLAEVGAREVRVLSEGHRSSDFDVDVDGTFLYGGWDGLHVGSPEGTERVTRYLRDVVMGPDGRVYGIWYHFSGFQVAAVGEDRLVHVYEGGPLTDLQFGPDGGLYGLEDRYLIDRALLVRMDVATGARSVVAELPQAESGFALDDAGRVYYVHHWAQTLVRLDPATGETDVLARRIFADELVLDDARVLYLGWNGLMAIPTDAQAHVVPRAEFTPGPAPDLAITRFNQRVSERDATGRETARSVTLTVSNVGRGPSMECWGDIVAGKTSSYVYTRQSHEFHIPPLAPGESVTVEWTWDTSKLAGRHWLRAMADLSGVHAEARDNNERRIETHVVVDV